MKVKHLKPKYKSIEAIETTSSNKFSIIGFIRWEYFKEKWGSYEVKSIKNYDSTHSTSIIISKKTKHDNKKLQKLQD